MLKIIKEFNFFGELFSISEDIIEFSNTYNCVKFNNLLDPPPSTKIEFLLNKV